MTNEDIIRIAREALKEDDGEDYYAYTHQIPHWWGKEDEIVKFANLITKHILAKSYPELVSLAAKHAAETVVAAEREACAKEAENRWLNKANCSAEEMYELQKKVIAEAIRARGQHE